MAEPSKDRDKAVEREHDWWTCECRKCWRKRYAWMVMQEAEFDDD